MDIFEAKKFYIDEITKEFKNLKAYLKRVNGYPEGYFKLEAILNKTNINSFNLIELKEFYNEFIEVKNKIIEETESVKAKESKALTKIFNWYKENDEDILDWCFMLILPAGLLSIAFMAI